MFGLLRIYIFFNFYFSLIKCNPGDDLSVRLTDRKLIERKRQDTREMCKIFNSEAMNTSPTTEALPLNKYGKRKKELKLKGKKNEILNKKSHRVKREINSINAAMNIHDEERVEKIVDKIYDDLLDKGQKVPYRRKMYPKTAPKQKAKSTTGAPKAMRRFPFAPHWLGDGSLPVKKEPNVEELPSKFVRFPNAIVPYFIDSSTYDTNLAETITKAFDYFEKATCIRLQRLRERPRDQLSLQDVVWLYISNPSGIRQCVHSNERAEIQGVQLITFGYDCMSVGDITHEIMHVLGFAHEHLRPDRDQHITILWENIKPGYKQYFEVHNETIVDNLPYDYASVLHYPSRAFSRNGKPTILTDKGIKIGQREALSEMDAEKIGILYSNECIKRNREYLLKTCPSVVKPEKPPAPVTKQEIDDYFRDRLWPYGVIIYTFNDPGEFSSEEKENIKAVINHIKNETCVEFREISMSENQTKDEDYPSDEDNNDNQSDEDNRSDDDNRPNDVSLSDDDFRETDDDQAGEDSEEDQDGSDNNYSSSYFFDTEELGNLVIFTSEDDPNDITGSATSSEVEPSLALKSQIRTSARKAVKTKDKTGVRRKNVKRNNIKNNVTIKNANSGGKKNSTNIFANGIYAHGNKLRKTNVNKKPTVLRKSKPVSGTLKSKPVSGTLKSKPVSGTLKNKPVSGTLKSKPFSGTPKRRHADNILVLSRSSRPGCPCPPAGKPKGSYVLKINADCFNTVNDLLHLFVHVLGLDHQHNMHDRDSYLHIVWDQLTEDMKDEMKKKLPPAASLGFPYDYQSVMHYPWLQIKDGKTNIMYPIWNDGWAMGQWQGLSTTDIQKLRHLYFTNCRERVEQLIKSKNKQKEKDNKQKEKDDEPKKKKDDQEENSEEQEETSEEQEKDSEEQEDNSEEQEENSEEQEENSEEQEDCSEEQEENSEKQEENNDGKKIEAYYPTTFIPY